MCLKILKIIYVLIVNVIYNNIEHIYIYDELEFKVELLKCPLPFTLQCKYILTGIKPAILVFPE